MAEALLHYLMLLPEGKLTDANLKFVVLGLAFLFLGTQGAAAGTVEVARSLSPKIAKFAATLLDACAYAGTGNVLKVQELLALCGDHEGGEGGGDKDKDGEKEGDGDKKEDRKDEGWQVCLARLVICTLCTAFAASAVCLPG